ncbi:MAG: cysteine desulfurase [Xanthomonadales bacterium]|nr:cysteine desulfurase [Xanthomonadales bacterium]
MTINKNLPNVPKRGHPDQYGVDLPQSSYLDPQMISKMANQIFQEVPLPDGTPEISGQSKLLNPAAFAGSSVMPPPPGPLQLEPLPGQIHTYQDSATLEAFDPASHLYVGETAVPDLSALAFGVLGSMDSPASINRLYFLDGLSMPGALAANPGRRNAPGEPQNAATPDYMAAPAGAPSAKRPQESTDQRTYALPGLRSRDAGNFDVYKIRNDFPALQQQVNGKPLVWLDNAATTQKPQCVIDALKHYYENDNSNVHRGAHTLAARATDGYEGARAGLARFIGAESAGEIVFVRGATEAVNLVAFGWGPDNLGPGDEIVLSELEHHSNIVPWQFLRDRLGIKIRVIPMTDEGELRLDEFSRMLGPRTKLVAVTQVSNALGTKVQVEQIAAMAHGVGARVLVDGAQSVPHFSVNVQAMDADFFVLSGHKMFGPTGIGALYAKQEILDAMGPWQGGGSMIERVTFDRSTFAMPPTRFEAGTPNIADAIGLGAAIDYLERLPFEAAMLHEQSLMSYAEYLLPGVPGLRLIGNPGHRVGSISLVMDGIEPQALGKFLDSEGIAVRSSHHCAQPALAHYGLEETVRPSLAFYNTHEEIDTLARALHKARPALSA